MMRKLTQKSKDDRNGNNVYFPRLFWGVSDGLLGLLMLSGLRGGPGAEGSRKVCASLFWSLS